MNNNKQNILQASFDQVWEKEMNVILEFQALFLNYVVLKK